MADNSPTLDVIIVTYNSRSDIVDCLDSVVDRTSPIKTTITVVDNASGDGTISLVRDRWPEVHVIDAGDNLGFSRANNLGVRATSSEYVLFLNPDTVVAPSAIQTLVASVESNPHIGIAGPRLVDPDGMPEVSWGPAISPWGELWQKRLLHAYDRRVTRIVRTVQGLSRQSRHVEWVSGACLLARRRDLEAVGLFDERYFMYTEDVDLCVRMRDQGRLVRYVAEAEVLHRRGRSASQNANTERRRRASQVAYYEKHHPAWAPMLRMYLRLTGKPFDV